jgi:hypothetical protein
MTKSLFATLAVTILTASSISAQSNPQLRVDLPFDFAAGSSSLPAGEYYVHISYVPGTIRMQNADGQHSVVVLAHGAAAKGNLDTARLVFHRYGDRYFLSQVFTPGNTIGEELPKSHDEQEQIAARHASKTVTVLASLK